MLSSTTTKSRTRVVVISFPAEEKTRSSAVSMASGLGALGVVTLSMTVRLAGFMTSMVVRV